MSVKSRDSQPARRESAPANGRPEGGGAEGAARLTDPLVALAVLTLGAELLVRLLAASPPPPAAGLSVAPLREDAQERADRASPWVPPGRPLSGPGERADARAGRGAITLRY